MFVHELSKNGRKGVQGQYNWQLETEKLIKKIRTEIYEEDYLP